MKIYKSGSGTCWSARGRWWDESTAARRDFSHFLPLDVLLCPPAIIQTSLIFSSFAATFTYMTTTTSLCHGILLLLPPIYFPFIAHIHPLSRVQCARETRDVLVNIFLWCNTQKIIWNSNTVFAPVFPPINLLMQSCKIFRYELAASGNCCLWRALWFAVSKIVQRPAHSPSRLVPELGIAPDFY